MPTNEEQTDLLEMYLDGALPAPEAEALRRRLERDSALAAELDRRRAERTLRRSAFAAMEGDHAVADRLLDAIRPHGRPVPRPFAAPIRYALAAAACVAIGFASARLLDTRNSAGLTHLTPAPDQSAYRVAITDDAGRIIAVQPFDSVEQAAEFSEDLRRWQERQDQIRNGQVTVRSASF